MYKPEDFYSIAAGKEWSGAADCIVPTISRHKERNVGAQLTSSFNLTWYSTLCNGAAYYKGRYPLLN